MTATSFLESVSHLPVALANDKISQVCGVEDFLSEKQDFAIAERRRDEYGDWQTNYKLALRVCKILKDKGLQPQIIIEPTCGKGNFVLAAIETFDSIEEVHGIEIYKPYIDELKAKLLERYLKSTPKKRPIVHLHHQSVFDFDFSTIKHNAKGKNILILGNPPWVTNSKLCEISSNNLPKKANFKNAKGFEAMTGKSNFDIAESITTTLLRTFDNEIGHIALLVKNTVVKNIVFAQAKQPFCIGRIEQHNIDAKKEFDVAVAASLFFAEFSRPKGEKLCTCLDFYNQNKEKEYGWTDDKFVSNTSEYQSIRQIDGYSQFVWWSGVKHDCSKIMELEKCDKGYTNALGETIDLEEDTVFPLLKSSDIKDDVICAARKYLVVTQRNISENTEKLKNTAPNTYNYLLRHADLLDNRGSSIYKNRQRFCLFGIGDYSFKPYKVVVSGLYKKVRFALVPPIGGKPCMLDDTCYLAGFDDEETALFVAKTLNSDIVQHFINSLCFSDAKRVINKDLLMRIDIVAAAKILTAKHYELSTNEFDNIIERLNCGNSDNRQLSLF